jgi:hypothetical protein
VNADIAVVNGRIGALERPDRALVNGDFAVVNGEIGGRERDHE